MIYFNLFSTAVNSGGGVEGAGSRPGVEYIADTVAITTETVKIVKSFSKQCVLTSFLTSKELFLQEPRAVVSTERVAFIHCCCHRDGDHALDNFCPFSVYSSILIMSRKTVKIFPVYSTFAEGRSIKSMSSPRSFSRQLCHWGPMVALNLLAVVIISGTYSSIQLYGLPTVQYIKTVNFFTMYAMSFLVFYVYFKAFAGPGFVPLKWNPVSNYICNS